MAENRERPLDFGVIWQAAEAWMKTGESETYRAGMTGEAARRTGLTPIASDLTHLLLPGLAALGVQGQMRPLPDDSLLGLMQEGTTVCLFAFEGTLEFLAPDEINDATPLPQNDDPRLLAQVRLLEVSAERLQWQERSGKLVQSLPEEFRTRFSHFLRLERSAENLLPRTQVTHAALVRWLEHDAAYPETSPREGDLQEPSSALAAAFLHDTVKTRRDYVSNRLRYAARCFEAAQVRRAYDWLLQALIVEWELSAAGEALLTPPSLPLTDTQRRELIYLARAGTSTLKILAARRLTHERHHPDARKTLHQLRFDADSWVRAAARPL